MRKSYCSTVGERFPNGNACSYTVKKCYSYQEREEPAGRRQAYHSLEEILLSSQSLSVGHVRTGRLVNELSSLSSSVRENLSRGSENEQIRILLERQKEQILADCRAEIRNTSSKPIMIEEVSKIECEAHVKSLNEMEN